MSADDKDNLIAALKSNVDGKTEVIERVWKECNRLKDLNKACFATMHRMHDAYSKPNLN